ncbi:M48 family metallopeptidase [Anaeromyxobacter sp. Fw109-5]|uniref:M48 family metallopeptidase n=1 Tax=Anaeromyxobacter sp. (strain Fw109-5) TaxID=404589 RepID=UPI0000ED760C|nr:M48 family metallopeptidase [Anaeromyxobacter sp. Fw109-5]ABS25912.1 peptidase M48 Ste24p [Anaeromyxobacter sp. Fw109-5]
MRSTLDFFGAQAAARRRTALLAFLFALAWLGTIGVVHLLVSGVLGLHPELALGALGDQRARDLLGVAGIVSLVTAGGALVHGVRLAAGGGGAVAELLGGVRIAQGTGDAAERQLLNVVEEMAIAAGVPVPAVYVLQGEGGINAFAAGFAPDRAVIAVTRGALEALTRDELQGVIAHELSHVVNLDTRLNLQLMALVGGLSSLALVGRYVLRMGLGGEGRRRRPALAPGLLGALVWAAGSVGAFFGQLIRLAVSRTREHLADASAVQFTRNPDGLAGALAKIAREGSALHSPAAPEAAHLFFADGLGSRLLATHPPIEERIRRIAPQLAPRLLGATRTLAAAERAGDVARLVPAVASGRTADVERARLLLATLPAAAVTAARAPPTVPALARALLADRDAAARALQLSAIGDGALRAEVDRLGGLLAGVDREGRMALLDLAAPALALLGPEGGSRLVGDLRSLAAADGRTTVFEWAVERIVARRVAARAPRPGGRARRLEDVEVECLELLSLLAWLEAPDAASAQAALDAGVAALGVGGSWRVLPRGRVGAARLEAALDALDATPPIVKARVLAACEACAGADGRVLPAEAEVLRAVAASLGVPAPPVVREDEGGQGRAPEETPATGRSSRA